MEQQDSPQKPDFSLFSTDGSMLMLTITSLLMVFMAGFAAGSQFSWAAIEPYFYQYLASITIVLGTYTAAFYAYITYKRGI